VNSRERNKNRPTSYFEIFDPSGQVSFFLMKIRPSQYFRKFEPITEVTASPIGFGIKFTLDFFLIDLKNRLYIIYGMKIGNLGTEFTEFSDFFFILFKNRFCNLVYDYGIQERN
jgi:hypothetical protein